MENTNAQSIIDEVQVEYTADKLLLICTKRQK